MENGILFFHTGFFPFLEKAHGFAIAPDEKRVTLTEAAEDGFTRHVFEGLVGGDNAARASYLRFLNSREATVPAVPFADPQEGDVKWLPLNLLFVTCSSNGMAAGNTMEEAMVQAFSEIFERYVSCKLIAGEAVPPKIPDEALRGYGFWPLVEALRADGDYDISFYDCSLGKGYPVAGCLVVNRSTGRFGMRLGSHPSFAVAVERTLTEAMQGRKSIESFTALNRVGSQEEAASYHNAPNISKVGFGAYNASLFLKEPDWEFAPWKEWEGLDNRGFLKKMLSLVEGEGFAPLVRDASFLGFPACYIVVPGMSDLQTPDSLTFRVLNTTRKISGMHRCFPRLTAGEEDALLKMICFAEKSVNTNKFRTLLGLPVYGGRMNSENVGGFLAYKRGDFSLASHFFRRLLSWTEEEGERRVLAARLDYLRYLQKGFTREEAARLIRRFFHPEVAEKVAGEMAEPETVMERLFPKPNCPDCEHCELAGKECDSGALAVGHKIYAALKKGRDNVSQEKMLKFLDEIRAGE